MSRLPNYEGNTFTTTVACISEELHIPTSTVRRTLQKFRDGGLIIAGSREKQFIPLELTPTGRILVERFTKILDGDEMDGS